MKRLALLGRLMRPYWRRRFHAFGDRSILHRPDWLYGPQQIAIGSDVVIFKSVWLSVERAARSRPRPVLRIGDRVVVRPYCTISASESIEIGDDVVLSALSTVIDSDHVHGGASDNVVYNSRLVTAPVSIGRGTWIGERVAVLRGANIGKFCTIGSNSVVRGTIPDYSIAVGAPARVVGSTLDEDARNVVPQSPLVTLENGDDKTSAV